MSDIYLSLTETPAVVTLSQPVISGALSSTVTVANTVTVALDANSLSALEQVTVTVGAAVSVSNFPSTQTVAGTVTANDSGALSIVNSSTVTKADVKFTAIAGAYNASEYASTYSLRPLSTNSGGTLLIDGNVAGSSILSYDGWAHVRVAQSPGSVVTVGSLPAISGTVTANLAGQNSGTFLSEPILTNGAGSIKASLTNDSITQICNDDGNAFNASNPLPISGTVTVGASSVTFNAYVGQRGDGTWSPISLQTGSNYVNTNVQNLPSGALTTRFGSVTTANTSMITSAVTNTSRKYLLAQNISAGTVTIGIGFSPTTTQGIQLAAGGGLTFDAFCPTGAVYWLGAVTGAAFTILEG